MPWRLGVSPIALPDYKNLRQDAPCFDREGRPRTLPSTLPSPLPRTPQPDVAELARRLSQSAMVRFSDAILRIAPQLPPLPDEREPIVTTIAAPPTQTIVAASPSSLADEERRARAFVDRNRKIPIYVERAPDGFIYPAKTYWPGNRLTEAGLRNPIAQRELRRRLDRLEDDIDNIVLKLAGQKLKDTSRETLVSVLPLEERGYISAILRFPQLYKRVIEVYKDGGKQRCELAAKAWQDAQNDDEDRRLELAAKAKLLSQAFRFRLPLTQALADELEQDAEEHKRRLLAVAAAAAAGSSDTGGSPSSIAPELSAEEPTASPRRQQRSAEPENSAGTGEPDEDLVVEIANTRGLMMKRKHGKLVPDTAQPDEARLRNGDFEQPHVQAALEQQRRRQWQFVRETWGVLTKSVTKSDVDGGSEAVIAALPEDQRQKASPWAATPIWDLMLRQLEKSGRRRTEAAVRRWEEALRGQDSARLAIAAQAAARLKRWPIPISPDTEAAIKQDVARRSAHIAEQQSMYGR